MRFPQLLVIVATVLAAPLPEIARAEPPALTRESLLRDDGNQIPNKRLFAYLREQSGNDADLRKLPDLVFLLGSRKFVERERATKQIIALKAAALNDLWRASLDKDQERASRAGRCAEAILDKDQPEITEAVVRALLRRKPPKVVEELLRFVPYAGCQDVRESIWFGLSEHVREAKKLDDCFLTALKDDLPARRALAGCLVARYGTDKQKQQAHKLLKDSSSEVRLRVAQGFLGAKDKSVVPVLIALLLDRSDAIRLQAEELLRWAAGTGAPDAFVAAATFQQRHAAVQRWTEWWKKNGESLDLGKRLKSPARPLLAFLCEQGQKAKKDGQVWLTGSDGTMRWQLTKLAGPIDAFWLESEGVLLIERPTRGSNGKRPAPGRFRAINLSGDALWQIDESSTPDQCQPLPHGCLVWSTSGSCIVEIFPNGQLANKYVLPAIKKGTLKWPKKAPKLPFSPLSRTRIVCLGHSTAKKGPREYLCEVDLKAASVPAEEAEANYLSERLYKSANSLEVLKNGKLLWGTSFEHVFVVEKSSIDWPGNLIPGSKHATALSDGSLLVGGSARLVEIDPRGRVAWEAFFAGQLQRVRPCLSLVRVGFERPDKSEFLPLRAALSSDGTRSSALRYLVEYGESFPELITFLEAAAAKWERKHQQESAQALRVIKGGTIYRLIRKTKDGPTQERVDALRTLVRDHYRVQILVPVLLGALQDKDVALRRDAARLAGNAKANPALLIPRLITTLSDSDAKVCYNSAGALGRFLKAGTTSSKIGPALFKTYQESRDRLVRSAAGSALAYVKPVDPRVAKAIIASLKDANMRVNSAVVLGLWGQEVDSVPDLLKALDAPISADSLFTQEIIRSVIVQSLGRMGPRAKQAIPRLIELLEDPQTSRTVREDIITRCFGRLGPVAKGAAPALRKLKREYKPDSQEARRILKALDSINRDN